MAHAWQHFRNLPVYNGEPSYSCYTRWTLGKMPFRFVAILVSVCSRAETITKLYVANVVAVEHRLHIITIKEEPTQTGRT